MIRRKIYPLIARLQNEDKINWYCFLIHNRASGVPTTEDDHSWYFHIRVLRKNDGDPSFLEYCVMTRKIEREEVESISGITKSLLKNDEIEEAWRMIGEQSEWLLHLLSIYKEDDEIPADQVWQFLRYLANMTQMSVM